MPAKNKTNGNAALSLVFQTVCHVILTFYADNFRPVPLAISAALSSGYVALQEAVSALVAHYRVDIVVGTL